MGSMGAGLSINLGNVQKLMRITGMNENFNLMNRGLCSFLVFSSPKTNNTFKN